jgi:hypothetical protein
VVRRLPVLLVADQRRAVGRGLLRARHGVERLVLDLDQLECVLRDVGRLGDDAGDLLTLVAHLVGDEHGLRVARQGRHPRKVVLRHQLAGDDGDDARQRGRRRRVDRRQASVGVRAPQDLHVEHPRQADVVEVLAPALDEARVLLALDGVTDAADLVRRGHHASLMVVAAAWTALTMFW